MGCKESAELCTATSHQGHSSLGQQAGYCPTGDVYDGCFTADSGCDCDNPDDHGCGARSGAALMGQVLVVFGDILVVFGDVLVASW